MYGKLIAKPDTWFQEGTEVFSEDDRRFTVAEFEDWKKSGIIICCGRRICDDNDNERNLGYKDGDARFDGECCQISEFEIYKVDDIGTEEYYELSNNPDYITNTK